MRKSWSEVEFEIQKAITAGWLVDYRQKLPSHPTKTFRQRQAPADVLGCCTHHNASRTQDPLRTAQYHVGPNHVSATGCPGILYALIVSQEVEPCRVILARELYDVTWSQGKADDGDHPEWSADENRHLVSVLVMGDFDEDHRKGKTGDPTPSQLQRWRQAVSWLQDLFGFGSRGFFGHFDFGKRHCPGRALRQQIECRRALAGPGLVGDLAWQQALLRWDPTCLPKYGADGSWGTESKRALVAFERAHKHKADGIRDPFSELLLMSKFGG